MRKPNGRGNDILYQRQGDSDAFEHYHGPLGGDVRQSIKGPRVNNRDELGGDQVQKIGTGRRGPKRPMGEAEEY